MLPSQRIKLSKWLFSWKSWYIFLSNYLILYQLWFWLPSNSNLSLKFNWNNLVGLQVVYVYSFTFYYFSFFFSALFHHIFYLFFFCKLIFCKTIHINKAQKKWEKIKPKVELFYRFLRLIRLTFKLENSEISFTPEGRSSRIPWKNEHYFENKLWLYLRKKKISYQRI